MSIFDRLADARDAFWGYNRPQTIIVQQPNPTYCWNQPRPDQNLPDYKADFEQLQQQLNALKTENETLRNTYQQTPKADDIETLRQQMVGTTKALTEGLTATSDLAKKNKCETDSCIVDLQTQIDELKNRVEKSEKRLDNHWDRIMQNEKSLVDAEKQIEANKKANEDTLALLKAKGVL